MIDINTAKMETCIEILSEENTYKWIVALYEWWDCRQCFSFLPAFFKCNLMNSYFFQKCKTNYTKKRASIVPSLNANFLRNMTNYELSVLFLSTRKQQIMRPPELLELGNSSGFFKVNNRVLNWILWLSHSYKRGWML